jgi:hypothetical protein
VDGRHEAYCEAAFQIGLSDPSPTNYSWSSGKEYLPPLSDVGFRNYSQFEEDGILLYLFSLIAPINRKCVEICDGNGLGACSANTGAIKRWST